MAAKPPLLDFSDVTDLFRPAVDRLVTLARAGSSMCLMGPPGIGATMLARRVPGVLEPLSDHARRWIAAEYSAVFSSLPTYDYGTGAPFRAPHHTVSDAAMRGTTWAKRHAVQCMTISTPRCVCGISAPDNRHRRQPWIAPSDAGVMTPGRPGEVELARFGVLYLDEVMEFRSSTLGATRDRIRAMSVGKPLVIASASPCPCGWHGSTARPCLCSDSARERWRERLARALATLGIASTIPLPGVTVQELRASGRCPSSSDLVHAMEAT